MLIQRFKAGAILATEISVYGLLRKKRRTPGLVIARREERINWDKAHPE